MTNSVYEFFTFIAFPVLPFFLSSTNGLQSKEEETFSGTLNGSYKGPCFRDGHRNEQCREMEGVDNGICSGYKCWCKKKCGNIRGMPTRIWKGPFDKQRREKENAFFGSCGGLFRCLCNYDC